MYSGIFVYLTRFFDGFAFYLFTYFQPQIYKYIFLSI